MNSNELVKIDNVLRQELNEKAGRVLTLERKGVKLLFSNVLEIETKLIKMKLEKNNNCEKKEL